MCPFWDSNECQSKPPFSDVDGINKGIKMARRKSTFFTSGSFNKTNGFSKTQHHTRGPPQGWHHPHTQAIVPPTLTTTVRGNDTGTSPQKAGRMEQAKILVQVRKPNNKTQKGDHFFVSPFCFASNLIWMCGHHYRQSRKVSISMRESLCTE